MSLNAHIINTLQRGGVERLVIDLGAHQYAQGYQLLLDTGPIGQTVLRKLQGASSLKTGNTHF